MWKLLLENFILTLIFYLAYPVLYRAATGGTTVKKARLYAFLNSFIVFILIATIVGEANGFPAFLYYIIGRHILTNKVKQMEETYNVNNNEEENDENDKIDSE